MQGTGQTLSRCAGLCAFWGMLIGVSLATGLRPAQADVPDSADQTAMAVPRIAIPGSGQVPDLPQPLSPSDAARIRRIFQDQAHGRIADADREIDDLDSRVLLGPILADRYLGRFYRTSPKELRTWLKRYGDQADADAVRSLLQKRQPTDLPPDGPATPAYLAPAAQTDAVPEIPDTRLADVDANPMLDRTIADRLQDGLYQTAMHDIARTRGLSKQYAGVLRARVARALFTDNSDIEAGDIGRQAWEGGGPGQRVGEGALIAGLSEWRRGHIAGARRLFSDAALAEIATPAERSAGAFWASRAALTAQDFGGADAWLRQAAQADTTFYGLIARRFLGWPIGALSGDQTLDAADLDMLDAVPRGRRIFALLQVGQITRAERELRFLWPQVEYDKSLRQSVLLVAQQAGLGGLAAQLNDIIEAKEGIPRQDLSFAVPPLHPNGGFRLSPALIYGLARAESNFDPEAVSPAGAMGLMQLRPETAASISGSTRLSARRLKDPGVNLDLGQRWVAHLAQDETINGNLIELLASYNDGVGNFANWSDKIDANDPLMYIEAIPVVETRRFVQRALTYAWLYAARLGLHAPGLDSIVAGAFPHFTQPEDGSKMLVSLH